MVCLGLEPRAVGWKAQTNPLSYGSTQIMLFLSSHFKAYVLRRKITWWLWIRIQCDQIGRFITVWAKITFLATIWAMFLKGSFSFYWICGGIFWMTFYRHWATFYTHWATFYTHWATFYSPWATFYSNWAIFFSHGATFTQIYWSLWSRWTEENFLHPREKFLIVKPKK